jgi:cobyrinic acid a,c-diamide synthase
MAWQPAPESLNQLASFLKDSLSGFDKNAQKQAELVSTKTAAMLLASVIFVVVVDAAAAAAAALIQGPSVPLLT